MPRQSAQNVQPTHPYVVEEGPALYQPYVYPGLQMPMMMPVPTQDPTTTYMCQQLQALTGLGQQQAAMIEQLGQQVQALTMQSQKQVDQISGMDKQVKELTVALCEGVSPESFEKMQLDLQEAQNELEKTKRELAALSMQKDEQARLALKTKLEKIQMETEIQKASVRDAHEKELAILRAKHAQAKEELKAKFEEELARAREPTERERQLMQQHHAQECMYRETNRVKFANSQREKDQLADELEKKSQELKDTQEKLLTTERRLADVSGGKKHRHNEITRLTQELEQANDQIRTLEAQVVSLMMDQVQEVKQDQEVEPDQKHELSAAAKKTMDRARKQREAKAKQAAEAAEIQRRMEEAEEARLKKAKEEQMKRMDHHSAKDMTDLSKNFLMTSQILIKKEKDLKAQEEKLMKMEADIKKREEWIRNQALKNIEDVEEMDKAIHKHYGI